MLRTLILLSTALVSPAFADEPVDFAEGAQGEIKAPIMEILRDSKVLGEEWKNTLDIQTADDFGVEIDVDKLRSDALNNPRVQALLKAQGSTDGSTDDADKYENKRLFVFASFSMPKSSLRQMLIEAEQFGATILFQGFLNNSVEDTTTAINETFPNADDAKGFAIDPTMFVRFDVNVVPQFVVLSDDIEPCLTSGCQSDKPPMHDKVSGNVPIEAALRAIVDGEGDAKQVANAALSHWEASQW